MIQNDLDLWEPAQRLGGFVKANAWSGHFPSQNICCLGCYEARGMSGEPNKASCPQPNMPTGNMCSLRIQRRDLTRTAP